MALEKYVSERRLGHFKGKLDSEGYKNTIETIKVNTQTQTIANKTVDLTIDTVDVSQASEKVTWTDVGEYSYEASLEKSTNGATFGIAGGSVELTSKTYVDETAPLLETEETTTGDGYNLAAIKHNKTNDKSGIVIKTPNADTAEINWFGKGGTSENSVTLPTKNYVDTNAGKIDKIKVNGTEQTITNKEVDIEVPVLAVDTTDARVSNSSDDSFTIGVIQDGVEYTLRNANTVVETRVLTSKTYVDATFRTEAQVEAAIAEAQTGAFVKVASYGDLPAEGAPGKIYLVPNNGSGKNVYDEYIWCVVAMMAGGGGGESPVYDYEKIGTTAVDLTGYVQETDLVEITEAEIDAMFA